MAGLGGDLGEGYLVNERFQLLRLLGRGGMGSVWVARHLALNIDVAVKFIDAALAGRDDLRSRFAQEARTAARIQSPHVVGILDYGFDGTARPFIAMELLEGEALASRLERDHRLSLLETARIVTQAAKGLSRAHKLGIVHRDLKPENLFLCHDDDGVLTKLLDFGIARDDTPLASASHRTSTGQLLGTPAYMSPEQALTKPHIDFRSDLYSLAVVAYTCIAGRLPFESDALGELIVSIGTKDPPPPSAFVPVPPGVDAWFKHAFQKEPSARFGSAKEMAEALVEACSYGSSQASDATLSVAQARALASDGAERPPTGNVVAWEPTPGTRIHPGHQPSPQAPPSPQVYPAPAPAPVPSWSHGQALPGQQPSWAAAMSPAPYPAHPQPARPVSTAAGTPPPSAHTVGGPPGLHDKPAGVHTRGPALLVYGLLALTVSALAGGGAYVIKLRGAAPPSSGKAGLVVGADGSSGGAAAASGTTAQPAATPPVAPPPSAAAWTSQPPSAPSATLSQIPPVPVAAKPSPSPPSPSGQPAGAPTHDYGLTKPVPPAPSPTKPPATAPTHDYGL